MQFFKPRVYADVAAATPLSPTSQRELIRLMRLFGNAGGLHKEALAAHRELERARSLAADAIHARPDEIIFTSGGTEANNMALGGAVASLAGAYGDMHV